MAKRYLDVNVESQFYIEPARTDKLNFHPGEVMFRIKAHEIHREKLRPHDCVTQSARLKIICPNGMSVAVDAIPGESARSIRLSAETDFPESYRDSIQNCIQEFRKLYANAKEEADYHYNSFHDNFANFVAIGFGVTSFIASLILFGFVGIFSVHIAASVVAVLASITIAIVVGRRLSETLNAPRRERDARRNEKLIRDTGAHETEDEMRVIAHRIYFDDQSSKLSREFSKRWS